MTQVEAIEAIDRELESLQPEELSTVLRFVRTLRGHHEWGAELVVASESLLAEDWLSPEDEGAWADL